MFHIRLSSVRRGVAWISGVGLAVVLGACADGNASTERAGRLSGAPDSPMSLSVLVLRGLQAEDTTQLAAVRLTEHEHNDLFWPEHPASNPEANFPVDFAWTNIQTRNQDAVEHLLHRYGGRQLDLDYVECRGETEAFETYEVLTDCWVGFQVDGQFTERQLFKDILVMDGGHKIFRFYK